MRTGDEESRWERRKKRGEANKGGGRKKEGKIHAWW